MRSFSFFGPKLKFDVSKLSKHDDARDCGSRDVGHDGHHGGHDFFASLDKFSFSGHGTHGSVKSSWAGKSCGRDRDNERHHDDRDEAHEDHKDFDFFGKGCGDKGEEAREQWHHGHDDDQSSAGCGAEVTDAPAADVCEEDELPANDVSEDDVAVDQPEADTGELEIIDLPVCELPADMPEQAAADPFANEDCDDEDTIAGLPMIDLPEEASDVAEDQVDWSDMPDDMF